MLVCESTESCTRIICSLCSDPLGGVSRICLTCGLGREFPACECEGTYSARSSSATATTSGLPPVGVCKTRRLEGFGSNWSLLAYSVATCVSLASMRAPRSPPEPCAETLGVFTTRSPRCQETETVDTPAGRPRTSHTWTPKTNFCSVFPIRRIAFILANQAVAV